MKLPPAIVAMRIVQQEGTGFRLWFPLFLLWPLLMVLLTLALLVSLLADAVRGAAGPTYSYTRLVWGGMSLVGETKGTEVLVQDKLRTVAFTLR